MSALLLSLIHQPSSDHVFASPSVRDWLYGIRNAEPEPASAIEPQTEAERLRIIYHMITLPTEEGGAGITPNHGEWEKVTAVFPLHDVETNSKWMKEWSKKTFLSEDDLNQIRDKFGESVRPHFPWDSGL